LVLSSSEDKFLEYSLINVSSLGRRLKKKKNGTILTAGFQLPEYAAAEDFFPWVAHDKG